MTRANALLVSFAVIFVVVAWGAWSIGSHAKSIRRLPDRSSFLEAVTAAEPLGSIYRVLLLQSASDRYYAAVVPWLFAEAELADNALNRYLLERLVLEAPPEVSAQHIGEYPIAPTEALTPLLEALLQHTSPGPFDHRVMEYHEWRAREELARGSHAALELLDDYPEGRAVISRWIDEKILAPRDAETFATYFPTLARLESVDLVGLLSVFEEALARPSDSETAIRLDWDAVEADSPQIADLIDWSIERLASGRLALVAVGPMFVTGFCTDGASAKALAWFDGLSDRRRSDAFDQLFSVADGYGIGPSGYGVESVESSYQYAIPACVPEAVLEQGLALSRDEPARHLAVLHAVFHAKPSMAAALFEAHLASGDSALRKGTIVLLARHEDGGFRYDLDDAFRGPAPRVVLFQDHYQYRGSSAFERYEALSGHEYDHVGKRFPPYLGSQSIAESRIAEWRAFVDEFPWFPATDDAYYRLAYAHLLAGDLAGAASTIAEYRARPLVDVDIELYMRQLEALIAALGRSGSGTLSDAALAAIVNSGWLWDPDSKEQAVESAILAVDLLVAFPAVARSAGVGRRELVRAREALDATRPECMSWGGQCELPEAYLEIYPKIRRVSRTDRVGELVRRIAQ